MQENGLKRIIKEANKIIDNWLDYQTYINELPGLAVGIAIDDEILFQKEYGYADVKAKKKFTRKHLFRIASHTKLFTATAIMILQKEEKLSIDDKVEKYLHWFCSEKDKNLQDITIRHLLTHTSGLSCDGKKGYFGSEHPPTLEDIKVQIKEGLSTSKINEEVRYSNIGYILLGQIIEVISNQEFGQYIQSKILDPLGMTNTHLDVNEENKSLHATGHGMKYPKEEREQFPLYSAGVFQAAAGLSSTIEDLIKFYQAHLYGNNVLLPDNLKKEMQRIQVKLNNNIRGLGFGLSNNPEGKIASHLGGDVGFRSMSGLVQDNRIIVAVFINAGKIDIENFFYSIMHLVESLDAAKEVFLQESNNQLNFEVITGFYDSIKGWGPELFCQIGSKLVLLNPENKYPAGAMQILEHKEGYVFTPVKETPSAKPGEDIQFINSPDGVKIYVDSKNGEHKVFSFSY